MLWFAVRGVKSKRVYFGMVGGDGCSGNYKIFWHEPMPKE
jgi:hypothetical protein